MVNEPTAALAELPDALAEGVERMPVLLVALDPMVSAAEEIVFNPEAVDEAAVVVPAADVDAATVLADAEAEDEVEPAAVADPALVVDAEATVEEPPAAVLAPPTSVPTPQGMVDPCWVGVAAATVAPDELAIVKRVVHKVFEDEGSVNW